VAAGPGLVGKFADQLLGVQIPEPVFNKVFRWPLDCSDRSDPYTTTASWCPVSVDVTQR
jgi:hypothetical protein